MTAEFSKTCPLGTTETAVIDRRYNNAVRAILIVLDSVGIGNAPDAASYGDEGANTLAHIFERCPELSLPNLCSLGLSRLTAGKTRVATPCLASFGRMTERSAGKDTTTGH